MTVIVHIGRRVPRKWFRRQTQRIGDLISFQENIWHMIGQSMRLGKKKCNASGKGVWLMSTDHEVEDLNYEIEWMKIAIRGSEEFEKEEYEEALKMYKPFSTVFKKEFPKSDVGLSNHLKTKILSSAKVEEAYEKGYGSMSVNNISNKLLEMGIMTHIEWLRDFESREDHIES